MTQDRDEQRAQPAPVPEGETHDFHAFEGFTAPPTLPGQDVSRERKAILDAWLRTLPEPPAWQSLYEDLLAERTADRKTRPRWDWRKALYIAWSCVPRSQRWPKSLAGLADLMGLTDTATIRHWRQKDFEIDRRIRELPAQLVSNHVADILDAALFTALRQDEKGFQDRKLLLEIANVYKPRQVQELTGGDKPVELKTELTDEELADRFAILLERVERERAQGDAQDPE
jgi:hypothetical protein